MTDMLTAAEAAKELGVSQRTISLWYTRGDLPGAIKLSQRRNSPLRIPRETVDRLARLQRQPPNKPAK